jgi:hypothetical protein
MSASTAPSAAAIFRSRLELFTHTFVYEVRPKWGEIGGECISGGAGLCEFASHELVGYLAGQGFDGDVYELWFSTWPGSEGPPPAGCVPAAPDYPGEGHFVAVFEERGVRIAVDITPRQFGDHFPFPYIWEVPCTK